MKINVFKIKLKDIFGVILFIKKKNKENYLENVKGWNFIIVYVKIDFICIRLFKLLWKIRDKKYKYSSKYFIIILVCFKMKV